MKLGALLLCIFLFPLAVAAKTKTILPDACGDDNVKFDVHTEQDQSAPLGPADGKAQLVLVQDQPRMAWHSATVRFGLDGVWVGANYGNSYFVLPINPGTHHLCADWEGNKLGVGALSFNAEAGKTYYFAAQITVSGGGTGQVAPTMGPNGLSGGGFVQTRGIANFNLSQLSEDEGKYRTKAWKLAVAKPK